MLIKIIIILVWIIISLGSLYVIWSIGTYLNGCLYNNGGLLHKKQGFLTEGKTKSNIKPYVDIKTRPTSSPPPCPVRIRYDEPWVIPYYGCASMKDRGCRCRGDNTINANKYCYRCNNYDPNNSIIGENNAR